MESTEYNEWCFDMEFWAEELARTPFDWSSLLERDTLFPIINNTKETK